MSKKTRFVIAVTLLVTAIIALSGCEMSWLGEDSEGKPGFVTIGSYVTDVRLSKNGELIVTKEKMNMFIPGTSWERIKEK